MARLEFWYDFASTYAYLSAMRIKQLAAQRHVEVVWRPFLLGPIFKDQGWTTSPFNIYPAKGRYMVRDMARLAAQRGLAFSLPKTFPANSLNAARLGLIAERDGFIDTYTQAVFAREFSDCATDISSDETLLDILRGLGRDTGLLEQSRQIVVKEALKARTQAAIDRDIFGAPTFMCDDGELFWGDDRLVDALDWAAALEVR